MPDSDIEARKRSFEQDPELEHKLATWIKTILTEVYDYNNMKVVKTEKTRRFEQDPELDHKLATWIRTILREAYNIEVVKTEKNKEVR